MPHDDIPDMFGRGLDSDPINLFVSIESSKLVILSALSCSKWY